MVLAGKVGVAEDVGVAAMVAGTRQTRTTGCRTQTGGEVQASHSRVHAGEVAATKLPDVEVEAGAKTMVKTDKGDAAIAIVPLNTGGITARSV